MNALNIDLDHCESNSYPSSNGASTNQRLRSQPSNATAPLRKRFAEQSAFLAILLVAAAAVGCGSESTQVAASTEQAADQAEQAGPQIEAPTEIVSQFLDRVRRGGDDSTASELLTKLAQQEMLRIGRPLQFPGSPGTSYQVMNAFPVPDQSDQIWVHTILSEPVGAESGQQPSQQLQYEVVWTLRQETSGWRISGFVVDQGDDLEPLQIDFENGEEMEARLAAIESQESAENPVSNR